LSPANQCPVCQARFRGVSICSRCGADLGRLMLLSAEAWWLREAARTAIAAGDFGRGFELAAKAQEAQRTPAGEALRKIGEWLES
jgi:predicted amidophosphoribosyltransferase